ncbi:SH3 and multiple ankyrin repeat domains protein 3 [Hetaerina americana]|uniref:SH3 and multiple ankyrin repeat domains protein 3 n=1 Tax=Hetaerina americana TaxID=62018 RepID=UPI003A7F50DF
MDVVPAPGGGHPAAGGGPPPPPVVPQGVGGACPPAAPMPVVTIPGETTIAVKVGPSTAPPAPPPGGSSSPPSEEGHILIRVHVPELNVQKCLQFPREELVWDVKQQCLAALPKELKESFNYGLFCPPVNGKAGKFLDEERRLADYPFSGPVGYLELKYKRRVYKMVNLDEKQLKALHTRANLRRLLDYVANGQVEKVAKMCSKGLDPNFHCPETGETPLTVAACTRNPSRVIVALVNGGALLDFRAKDGSTSMHRAVERNSYEAVKTLLDLGASPNYRDARGLTPLYIAVAGTGPADAMLCEALLHDHAVLGAQDLQGWQEVHQACRNGLVQHLEHLLFYGADTEARNASGNTPLHVCAVDNRESCARLLLFRGADPNALNYANQTPYQVAVIAGNLELAEIIRNHHPENVVPFREPPRYNPKRRRSGFPPTSSASSYTISDHKPTPPTLPRTQSDSRLENPSDLTPSHPPRALHHQTLPASIVPTVATTTNSANGPHHHHHHHHHHQVPLHQRGGPPSPSPSNRSLPPFSSASSSLSEASSTGSAATGSTVTDKSLDTVSDSSGVGTSNSGGSSTGGGGASISIRGGSTGGEPPVAGMTFETGTTTVVCVEDYPGTLPGHLPIARGDIIEVTGATDCGLLEGSLHGSSGLFPTHCVQEVQVRQGVVVQGTSRPSRVRGRRENSIKHFATAPRLKKQLPAEPRTVILHRARRGFGFVLRGAKATSPLMELTPSERCPALQYLDDVDAGGVADMAGLRKGDFLLAINDEDVSQASHEHVVDLIRRSRDLVTMTVVSGIVGPVGTGGLPGALSGALSGALPASGTCRSGSQTLPSRQYSTLPRKMTGGGARTPAPMPPRRDPKTTLSVGRARARSMVAGLSEYEATSRHGRKPSSTEEGEDGEDEADDGDEEEEEEEEEEAEGGRGGVRTCTRGPVPMVGPSPSTFAPHSTTTSTLIRHGSSSGGPTKTPPLPQSPPPVVLPRTPPPGVPKTASIRSRPTSSRITAAELEELFARQGSPVEGAPPTANGVIPNRAAAGLCHTLGARGSPPTPKVYASVAEMKRSKDKGGRYRTGTEVLRMLHKAFHSTPDLVASKGAQGNPSGVGPKSRSQDDIPPHAVPVIAGAPARLYHHSWRSLERLAPPSGHSTRSLPRRPGQAPAPPPPNHPPPPPPGQDASATDGDANYANLDAGDAPPHPPDAAPSTIMSSFRPAEGAKLYASPEDVKTVAYRVPSAASKAHHDGTLRRRAAATATAASNKARSQSLPPSTARTTPHGVGVAVPPQLSADPEQSACTSFRPESGAATPVEGGEVAPEGGIGGGGGRGPHPPPPGSNPYAQPYHHGLPDSASPGFRTPATAASEWSAGSGEGGTAPPKGLGMVRYLPTGSDGSGPPIPEPDYSLSESEEGASSGGEEEEGAEKQHQPPPPPPPEHPGATEAGTAPAPHEPNPSSPQLKDLLVQKVAERQGRLSTAAAASNNAAENNGKEEEEAVVAESNGEGGKQTSPKSTSGGASSGLPHSFSVEEIQKVRTQLKSSKSYPSDFLLEDGDNSSSGVSSDQDIQNEHPQPLQQQQQQTAAQPIGIQQQEMAATMTLTRRGNKELIRRNSQEEAIASQQQSKQQNHPHEHQLIQQQHHHHNSQQAHHNPPPTSVVVSHQHHRMVNSQAEEPVLVTGATIMIERPTPVIIVEGGGGGHSSRSSDSSRRREDGGRRGVGGGTLTKNAVSLVKLPPPMETDGEGAEVMGSAPTGVMVPNAVVAPSMAGTSNNATIISVTNAQAAGGRLPSVVSAAPGAAPGGRSSERSIEESLRLIRRHADMLNLTDFSRVVPPPPEFGGGGRGGRAASDDDLAAVLAPPPEFSDMSSVGGCVEGHQHRTTIRVVGRKSGGGTRSDGEGGGSQKVYVTKVKAKSVHHHGHQEGSGGVSGGRVTTVRIVGSVPKGSSEGEVTRVTASGHHRSK